MTGRNLAAGLTVGAVLFVGVGVTAARQSASASDSRSVKLVGCLERDTPASSAGAATAADITAFKLTGIDASSFKGAGPGGKDLTAVRLWSKEEFELIDHVGREVEMSGKFVDQSAAPPAGTVVTAQGPVQWMPVVAVASFHTIASACK